MSDGKWPCSCTTCQMPMKPGDGPRPPCERYPYRHDGPPVHGSKLADYLISEVHLREDEPELFRDA